MKKRGGNGDMGKECVELNWIEWNRRGVGTNRARKVYFQRYCLLAGTGEIDRDGKGGVG